MRVRHDVDCVVQDVRAAVVGRYGGEVDDVAAFRIGGEGVAAGKEGGKRFAAVELVEGAAAEFAVDIAVAFSMVDVQTVAVGCAERAAFNGQRAAGGSYAHLETGEGAVVDGDGRFAGLQSDGGALRES